MREPVPRTRARSVRKSGAGGRIGAAERPIALTYHERWDGSGYPHGLAGDAIPVEWRIFAVADVFDALPSDRVYRPALSVTDTVELMKAGWGTQFDPEFVDLLLDQLGEALAAPWPGALRGPVAGPNRGVDGLRLQCERGLNR